jgi:hypothetical protein
MCRYLFKVGKLEKAFAAFVAAESKRTRTSGATDLEVGSRVTMAVEQPHPFVHNEEAVGSGIGGRKTGWASSNASWLSKQVSMQDFFTVNPLMGAAGTAGRERARAWSKHVHVIEPGKSHPFFEHDDAQSIVARNLLYKESCDVHYPKVKDPC